MSLPFWEAFLISEGTVINNQKLSALLIAGTGIILFSSKAVMVKLAYGYEIDELSLLLLRMVFALPFYLGVWAYKRSEWKERPLGSKKWVGVIALGLVGYYFASFFDFKGLTYISASLERLILFTYPTIVLILSAIFLKKKVTGFQLTAILITYAGLAIIFLDNQGIASGATEDVITGSAFILLSAFTYAIYLTGTNFMIGGIGTLRLTTIVMSMSCLSVIIHFSIVQTPDIFGYPYQVYVIGLLMAVFATVLPSFMINEAIKRIGAPDVSILGSLGPVSTITLSMIFLGERLTLIQFFGALVIISGVAIISLNKR
ncbi:MAG: EamA family transporter [Balneola sp.]|nr:EamA family transporter [Balneola sp.]